MNEAQLNIAMELVNVWHFGRKGQAIGFLISSRDFIEIRTAQRKGENSSIFQNWNEILTRFPEFAKREEELNRTTGVGFNALKFFEPGETMHSYMVAHLLNPRANHGQKNLFLKKFLQLIGIEYPDTLNWVVTAEEGRVDIMLRRKNPHAVIIIENKSNWAGDQPNQLYRYWYENIYVELKNRPIEYGRNAPEKYRVIYLPPDSSKQPADNSLQRPDYLEEPLPLVLPMDIDTRSFRGFVVEWLEECIPEIPESNYRIREYVKQYVELWKD